MELALRHAILMSATLRGVRLELDGKIHHS